MAQPCHSPPLRASLRASREISDQLGNEFCRADCNHGADRLEHAVLIELGTEDPSWPGFDRDDTEVADRSNESEVRTLLDSLRTSRHGPNQLR